MRLWQGTLGRAGLLALLLALALPGVAPGAGYTLRLGRRGSSLVLPLAP